MNREEAQNILELCRPGHTEDLDDSLISKAFEQLDQDSELSSWYEEQQILDEMICSELNKIEPPVPLKSAILNGMHVHSLQKQDEPADSVTLTAPKTTNPPIKWLRPLTGIAAIFLLFGVFWTISGRKSIPQITETTLIDSQKTSDSLIRIAEAPEIIQFLEQQVVGLDRLRFSKRSEQADELTSYLKLVGMPSPAEIPQSLAKLPTIGCKTFDYYGKRLSMICFKDKSVYHLIIANKTDFYHDLSFENYSSAFRLFEYRKQLFKLWSANDQIYILVTENTGEDIPEFI